MLGEESGRTGTGGNGRTWLVDPLCGTLNYSRADACWSRSTSLCAPGTHRAVAASADPFSEEVFWTDGVAAYVRLRRDGPATRPVGRVDAWSTSISTRRFLTGTSFLAARMLADDGFIGTVPPTCGLHHPGRGLGRCRPPRRLRDGRPRPAPAASTSRPGIALCEAAGCVVTGIDGRPLHAGGERPRRRRGRADTCRSAGSHPQTAHRTEGRGPGRQLDMNRGSGSSVTWWITLTAGRRTSCFAGRPSPQHCRRRKSDVPATPCCARAPS